MKQTLKWQLAGAEFKIESEDGDKAGDIAVHHSANYLHKAAPYSFVSQH
jgi:hypothetical protein